MPNRNILLEYVSCVSIIPSTKPMKFMSRERCAFKVLYPIYDTIIPIIFPLNPIRLWINFSKQSPLTIPPRSGPLYNKYIPLLFKKDRVKKDILRNKEWEGRLDKDLRQRKTVIEKNVLQTVKGKDEGVCILPDFFSSVQYYNFNFQISPLSFIFFFSIFFILFTWNIPQTKMCFIW